MVTSPPMHAQVTAIWEMSTQASSLPRCPRWSHRAEDLRAVIYHLRIAGVRREDNAEWSPDRLICDIHCHLDARASAELYFDTSQGSKWQVCRRSRDKQRRQRSRQYT